MNNKVSRLALASRLIVITLQFLANILIPDHHPDVFQSPANVNKTEALDNVPKLLLGGLQRWDAQYFLHVSEYGYTYENTLAFYPLFPTIVGVITTVIREICPFISFQYIALIVATILNIYFFYRAANCLYELTIKVLGDTTLAWNAVVLFCFNPASIFFSAPYSECLFSWLTFSLMLECATTLNFWKVSLTLGLSILCRSNGLINIGFPVYFFLKLMLLRNSISLKPLFKLFFVLCIALMPLVAYNSYVFQLFCMQSKIDHPVNIVEYAVERGYVLAGPRNPLNSPWCDRDIPYAYSYIQKHYWDVGFLRYWKFKQIPNFILASPIIILFLTRSFSFLQHSFKEFQYRSFSEVLRSSKAIPFIVHGSLLTIFCTLCIHIQVTTRLLASATPCLYWFAGDYLPKNFEGVSLSLPKIRSMRAAIIYWFGGYFVIGTMLFSNFYPWT